jgi:hypothetical protein
MHIVLISQNAQSVTGIAAVLPSQLNAYYACSNGSQVHVWCVRHLLSPALRCSPLLMLQAGALRGQV